MIPQTLNAPGFDSGLRFRQAALGLVLCFLTLPASIFAQESKEDARRKALADNPSPFVKRHAQDLVKWYTWGEEVFDMAKRLKKPLYVCVGYDSCHWCLRMQEESFQNPEIAKILNENFVNVIVDRERRPVLDSNFMTYMNANQGQSGWPLNVWITPDGVPFSVGSYFPTGSESASGGLPEFTKVLRHITAQWNRFPEYIDEQSKRDLTKLVAKLEEMDKLTKSDLIERSKDPKAIHTAAYETISTRFDPVNGGFSNPFQFPQTGILRYLTALKLAEREGSFRAYQAEKMMMLTGERMAGGGLFDHLEGGFHRYTLEPAWEVPRFEKLLITQASMADCYLRLYRSTGEKRFLDVARATLRFVESHLDAGDGLMHGGLHSDSALSGEEGEVLVEGAYYTWEYDDFIAAAGAEAAPILAYLMDVRRNGNLSPGGNSSKALFGKNVLRMNRTLADAARKFSKGDAEIASIAREGMKKLVAARRSRPKPALNDNIVIGWNLLMASAFAEAGILMDSPKFVDRAAACVQTILSRNFDAASGTLYHVADADDAREGCYAFDYATLVNALLSLYEVTLDDEYLVKAREIQEHQNKLFWDSEEGGFFESRPGLVDDFLRLKSFSGDGAPSTNAVAANNLFRLADLCGKPEWLTMSREIWSFSLPRQVTFPTSVPLLLELEYHLGRPSKLVVVTGAADSPLAKSVVNLIAGKKFFHTSLIRFGQDTPAARENPMLSKISANEPAVIVFHDGVPSSPMTDIAAVEAVLSK